MAGTLNNGEGHLEQAAVHVVLGTWWTHKNPRKGNSAPTLISAAAVPVLKNPRQ